jgi:hypothetical protein
MSEPDNLEHPARASSPQEEPAALSAVPVEDLGHGPEGDDASTQDQERIPEEVDHRDRNGV